MNNKIGVLQYGFLFVAFLMLTACGGDAKDDPVAAPRPFGSISGASALIAGTVTVYAYTNGTRGAELTRGEANEGGQYLLEVQAPNQPVLVCASGGTYIEMASNTDLSGRDHELCAVAFYQSGARHTVNISVFSHLAAALATYNIQNNEGVAAAIEKANYRISNMLGIDIWDTQALDITDVASATTFVTDRHLMGFATAAVSQLTVDISEQNTGVGVHELYHSLAFAALAYDDVAFDGRLDGNGTEGPLSFGTVSVSADTYRYDLAMALFNAVNSTYNHTSLQASAVRSMAQSLNQSTDAVFGEAPVRAFDCAPAITFNTNTTGYQFGTLTVQFTATDACGIDTVTLSFGGAPVNVSRTASLYTASVDTTRFVDGPYELQVVATNVFDRSDMFTRSVDVFNTPPSEVGGKAFDGLIINGDLRVFDFTGGVKGDELGATTTDFSGQYSLSILSPARPVLLEITSGRYVEEASALSIPLETTQNHILRAVSQLVPGEAITVNLTTWTNIAAGLAQYRMANGMAVADAIATANFDVSQIVNVDIMATVPLDITDNMNAGPLTNGLVYGFYAGALSEWTRVVSDIFERDLHSTINSINFSMAAYDDVVFDGLLNGVDSNGPVVFGGMTVNANTYRHDLALGMIRMVDNVNNRTGLAPINLLSSARHLNDSNSALFGGASTIALDEGGSTVSQVTPGSGVYNTGFINLDGIATGILPVTSIELLLDGSSLGLTSSVPGFSFELDTLGFSDCTCTLTARTTNLMGTVSDSDFVLQIDNTRYLVHELNRNGVITTQLLRYNHAGIVTPYREIAGQQLVALHPNNTFMYVRNWADKEVFRYLLDNNGDPSTPALMAFEPWFALIHQYAFDPSGRFLFHLQLDNAKTLVSYALDGNGNTTLVGDPVVLDPNVVQTVSRHSEMAVHPSNNNIYYTSSAGVEIYFVQADGSLAYRTSDPSDLGEIVFDATGQNAYAVNYTNNQLAKIPLAPDGALRDPFYVLNLPAPFVSNGFSFYAKDLTFTPDQQFLLLRVGRNVHVYSVDVNDTFYEVVGSPFTIPLSVMRAAREDSTSVVEQPSSVHLDVTGRKLFAIGGGFGLIHANFDPATGEIGSFTVALTGSGATMPIATGRGAANAP